MDHCGNGHRGDVGPVRVLGEEASGNDLLGGEDQLFGGPGDDGVLVYGAGDAGVALLIGLLYMEEGHVGGDGLDGHQFLPGIGARHFLKAYIAVIFYLDLLFRPFLGSNQQNTV